jgi:L-histidine N-alpha-methyltransferase
VPASSTVTVDVHLDERDLRRALEQDVRAGLSASPKHIPPTWFYDEEGSRLFEEITRLAEYYPTRAERDLLERHAHEVASLAGADSLVELGAGSCEKTRLLLDALAEAGSLSNYVPFDVSAEFLTDAAGSIADEYPGLVVHAVVGDFLAHLDRIPKTGRRLVAFLGGTIGNLAPSQRARFLLDVRATMAGTDALLLGTDLVKDRRRIIAAYDDAEGVTARFNRNVLSVMNNALGANFVPERFEHVVRWDEEAQWIEMRLRATRTETVDIAELGMTVTFDKGEELRTEISAKFTPEGVAGELAQAGFAVDRQWGADKGEFLLTLARPSR